MADRWNASPSSPCTAPTCSRGRSSLVTGELGQRGAGARGRCGRLRPRRQVRRRRLLRSVREAGAHRARRSGHARVRAAVVRRPDARARRGARARASRSTASPRRTCSTTSTRRSSGATACRASRSSAKIVGERSTNWCIVPARTAPGRRSCIPTSPRRRRTSGCGASSSMCCASTSRDPAGPGTSGWRCCRDVGERLTERRFDAIELRGPGHRADDRDAADAPWWAGRLHDRRRAAPPAEPADRGGLHDAGPAAHEGHVTSTKPLVLQRRDDRRGLRVRFESGKAVEIDADQNVEALRSRLADRRGRRFGSASSRSSTARAASGRSAPSSTTRCSTRTPPATSRSARLPVPRRRGRRAARERERHAHRLHDRLAGARSGRRDRRRRARAGAPRRRLAGLSRTAAGSAGRRRIRLNPYHARVSGMTDLAETLKEALRMTTTELPGPVDLSEHGIDPSGRVYRNPTTALLYTHALARGDGRLAEGGPLAVDTGKFTGRSPKDKFLVEEAGVARTASGGARSTSRSPERTSTGCATRSRRTSSRPTRST